MKRSDAVLFWIGVVGLVLVLVLGPLALAYARLSVQP